MRARLRHATGGIETASGNLLAFLDADDLWYPEACPPESFLCKHPDIGLCLANYSNFWAPELAEEEARYKDQPLSQPSASFNIDTLIARREVFAETLFNEDMRQGENTDWFMSVLRQGRRAEVLPEVLARRRFHGQHVASWCGGQSDRTAGQLENVARRPARKKVT